MKTTVILSAAIGILISSCHSKRNQFSPDGLSGAYVREYTFEVVHSETGIKIGTRIIRDTIFIKRIDRTYEVSNRKWMFSNYDDEGWRDMQHAEDRPIPTYHAIFDKTNKALISEQMEPIRLGSKGKFYLGMVDKPYQKIKNSD